MHSLSYQGHSNGDAANRMRLRLQPRHYMQCGCCVRPTGSLTRDKRTVTV